MFVRIHDPNRVTSRREVLLHLPHQLRHGVGRREDFYRKVRRAFGEALAVEGFEAFLANEGDIRRPHGAGRETESSVAGVNPTEAMLPYMVVKNGRDPHLVIAMVQTRWRHRDQLTFVELGSHRIVVGHLLQLVRCEERLGAHIQILSFAAANELVRRRVLRDGRSVLQRAARRLVRRAPARCRRGTARRFASPGQSPSRRALPRRGTARTSPTSLPRGRPGKGFPHKGARARLDRGPEGLAPRRRPVSGTWSRSAEPSIPKEPRHLACAAALTKEIGSARGFWWASPWEQELRRRIHNTASPFGGGTLPRKPVLRCSSKSHSILLPDHARHRTTRRRVQLLVHPPCEIRLAAGFNSQLHRGRHPHGVFGGGDGGVQ